MKEKPKKTKYKTANWKDYNAALKARGLLLVWFDKDMDWQESQTGGVGEMRNSQTRPSSFA